MDIDWTSLRTLDGSQRTAFEELCCQLAAREQVPQGSKFTRVGAPDAGRECYWVLPNGDKWAWQAKFFVSPPDDAQWQQIDESVKTALDKESRIVSYTICTPLDRQDPKIDNQLWFQDKWDLHLAKWNSWAAERGLSIEFDYWGKHEIFLRLSQEAHQGRYFFWFNKEYFSNSWFSERLDEAIANAGPRYTPELNVALPIAHILDGLARTPDFFKKLDSEAAKAKKAFRSASSRLASEVAKHEYDVLESDIKNLLDKLQSEKKSIGRIDWDALKELIVVIQKDIQQCIEHLEQVGKEKAEDAVKEQPERQKEFADYERYHLRDLSHQLYSLESTIHGTEAQAANTAALLVTGKAGTGKTHLFCDVAKQRLLADQPTVMLLGEQFRDSEPWSQIINLLGFACSRDQFLGALDASAEGRGQRALILIDALNEGEGKRFWRQHLAGMLATLAKYEWLSIAVSVRSSYEDVVIPENLVSNKLVRVEHVGFADHEYEAVKTFFDYYGVERPSIPILSPEFSNPLFLKLFCKGLRNSGYTRIPEGLQGITVIFDFFLDSLNEKLSKPDRLDFNSKARPIHVAVSALAEAMASKEERWLSHTEAQSIIDRILPPKGYETSLFRQLIAEGLLAEDRFLTIDEVMKTHQSIDGIRFAYERLSDHLIARNLLDRYLDSERPEQSLELNQPLGHLVTDEYTCWRNSGLIEALSIQIPERVGKELGEIAPSCAEFDIVRKAFVESILWRSPTSIGDNTLEHAEAHALRNQDTFDEFTNVILTVAINPQHPYNADFLHRNLIRQELSERDAWWSIFLHEEYGSGEASPVNRLVNWAWKTEDKSHISDASFRLAGIALSWFLTTSNRFLRDRATKALIALFSERLHILNGLLKDFAEVNDPYVSERLYAVAYGCVMRSSDKEHIRSLAQDVYDQIFRNDVPPPNILLRDYARGVIERALYLGLDIDILPTRIRPPYHSEWPTDIPSKEDLESLGGYHDEMPNEEWSRVEIYDSVMGWGDFARYIIGTNSSFFEWSSKRLGEPSEPSLRERYDSFVASLTERQRKAFQLYEHYRNALNHSHLMAVLGDMLKQEVSEQDLAAIVELLEQRLRKTLGKKKVDIFGKYILLYLDNPNKDRHQFDLSIIQRWILKKVFDLGWSVEKFGRFDRYVNYHRVGREPDKPERIGKKYQWIAYHEILARVADNFQYRGNYLNEGQKTYEGPWQLRSPRDLDPSFLLDGVHRDRRNPTTSNWWASADIEDWNEATEDAKWLIQDDDLPDPRILMQITDPGTGQWLNLHGFYDWEQPFPDDGEEHTGPRGREVFYFLDGYLIDKSHVQPLLEWARQQDFVGKHLLPDPLEWHYVYLGEFYWSPCYLYEYGEFEEDNTPESDADEQISWSVVPTTEEYYWERHYDCSINETVICCTPSNYLVHGMKLEWQGVEGKYCSQVGELVAFDPSVFTSGPTVLLVRKDYLLTFLKERELALFWIVRGEKNAYGKGDWPNSFLGRLHINGGYTLSASGIIEGNIRTIFKPARDESS